MQELWLSLWMGFESFFQIYFFVPYAASWNGSFLLTSLCCVSILAELLGSGPDFHITWYELFIIGCNPNPGICNIYVYTHIYIYVYHTRNNKIMAGTRTREAVGMLAMLSTLATLRKCRNSFIRFGPDDGN
jgi:hypothetical protein